MDPPAPVPGKALLVLLVGVVPLVLLVPPALLALPVGMEPEGQLVRKVTRARQARQAHVAHKGRKVRKVRRVQPAGRYRTAWSLQH